jgi:CRISPR-associated protein Cas5d
MIERGGRRDIFLGTRECQGYVKPCIFGESAGFYDDYGEINLGLMVHGFDYPDETGKDEMSVRLWKNVTIKDGIVFFPLPFVNSSEIVTRFIKKMKMKDFVYGENFIGLNESELENLYRKEVKIDELGAESL